MKEKQKYKKMNQIIKSRIEEINRGKIPEGYKKTSVGIVPIEWAEHTLGDIFKFKNGLNKEKEAFGQGTPIVNYTDVWKKRGLKAKDIKGRVVLSKNEIQNYEAKCGDVFFTRTSETIDEIGYSSVLLEYIENAVFSGFVLRARPYNDLVIREYHQYCYSEPLMRHEIIKRSSMTTRALTSGPMLSQVAINLPSHREQSKIAEILMKWDKAIELQEKYIEKANQQRIFLLKKVFEPKQNWSYQTLGDNVDLLASGGTPSTKILRYFDGNIVWVSIDDISQSGKYINKSNRTLSLEGLQNSSAKLFPKGTILYAMYASIGKCAIANIDCATSQAIIGIVPSKNSFDNQYLYYYLCSIQERISTQGQQGTQANLNKGLVESFKIPTPMKDGKIDIDEQKRISKILIAIDNTITLNTKKLESIKQQRKVLQQYLLNGIVRV